MKKIIITLILLSCTYLPINSNAFDDNILMEPPPQENKNTPKTKEISQLPVGKDKPTAVGVAQGHAVIAKLTEEITDIQTFGLGPCIGVCIYNKEKKIGVVAHIDIPSRAKDILKIIERLKNAGIEINDKNLEISVIGGSDENLSAEKAIIDVFKKLGLKIDLYLKGGYPTMFTEQSGRAIILSLDVGTVSEYKESIENKGIGNQGQRHVLSSTKLKIIDRLNEDEVLKRLNELKEKLKKGESIEKELEELKKLSGEDLTPSEPHKETKEKTNFEPNSKSIEEFEETYDTPLN